MSRPMPQAVFALKAWTIKESGGKYYVSPTASFDDKTRWSKPYDSLQRACTAIARKLASEWQQRDKRRRDFHGTKGGVR
jgi:hypothetical protein